MKDAYIFVEDNLAAHDYIRELWKNLRMVRKFPEIHELIIAKDYIEAITIINSHKDCDCTVITDIFFPQETGTGKREMADDLAKEIQTALEKYSQIDPTYLNSDLHTDALEGLKEWSSSCDETEQPLGLMIAKECIDRDIYFYIATSLNHHSKKAEGVFRAIYAMEPVKKHKHSEEEYNLLLGIHEAGSKYLPEADKSSFEYWKNFFQLYRIAGGLPREA